MRQNISYQKWSSCSSVIQNIEGQWQPAPDLMTEEELIQYLRIPEVSKAKDYHNVIENLIRMRGLPRIHIANKTLFPLQSIQEWILTQVMKS